MKPPNDQEIATALAEMRPAPAPEFAAELDGWAAAGFPRGSGGSRSRLAAYIARLHDWTPRRLAFAGAATGLTAIVVATVVIASSGSSGPSLALDRTATEPPPGPNGAEGREPKPFAKRAQGARAEGESASSVQHPSAVPSVEAAPQRAEAPASALGTAVITPHRDVERSAGVALLADPADVASDSTRVFAAVHDAHGIVLRSTTTSGRHAGARFELLIPSARMGDALAAISAIDQVRSRHEATADITKPTVAVAESLRDSRAKIDGLLSQLASAETEAEREAAEIALAQERRHAAALSARLNALHQRADLSRVSVRIESGPSSTSSGGGWGIDDAFHDAGRILGIAAGVTLIGLAVLAPIALLVFLAWLARRAWLRTVRARALGA